MKNKVVFITGGGRGLGAGLAEKVIHNGGYVYLVDVNGDDVSRRLALLGDNAAGCTADVTNLEEMKTALASCKVRFNRIDAVIANAGILRLGTIEHMPVEDFEQIMKVNVNGVFNTIRASIPYLRESQGYLQVISSLAAAIHTPLMAHYSASKAAAEALADVARQELESDGIDVGCVHPTFAKTDMIKENDTGTLWGGHKGAFGAVEADVVVEAMYEGILRRSRKIISPKPIAPLVLAPGLFHKSVELISKLQGSAKALAKFKDNETNKAN